MLERKICVDGSQIVEDERDRGDDKMEDQTRLSRVVGSRVLYSLLCGVDPILVNHNKQEGPLLEA